MNKIPQEVIDEIKRSHDLVNYIRPHVKRLRKTGKVWSCLCPFHPDTKNSFFIDPAKQLWNCLGACSANGKGSGGDIIAFAMKYHGWSFRETVERLSPPKPITLPETSRLKNPVLFSQVIERYHRSFLESRTAQEYIASRGLDPVLAKQYKAGYVDGSLLEAVAKDSNEWKILQEIGIITDAGNEMFRTCVVFPLTAFNSIPVNLYGRPVAKDNNLHMYLPGPRRGLFNWQQAKTFSELILAESVFDALSFIQCGYLNTLPIYGVNGFIQEHIDFVVRHRIKKVILALDPDEAGSTASERIAAQYQKLGIATQRLEVPAEDPNALLQKEGVERFKVIIDELLKKESSSVAIAAAKELVEACRLEIKDGELSGAIEERNYSIRNIPKKVYSKMRLAVRVTVGGANYLDSVDLISMRNRASFAARAAAHFDLPKPIIERDLIAIADAIEAYQKQPEEAKQEKVEVTGAEKEEALAYLQSLDLLGKIAADMEALGYVGEEANKKLGYLGSISRFLDDPFSIVILSQSGSGKSYLAEVLVKLTAPEDVKMYSRLTPQALFYTGEHALSHKFLVIEEKAGSEAADYPIRALQSRHELSIAATIKNPETGKMQTAEFKVYGPTAFLETTTASRINYENSTRCFEIYLDESVQQTRRIHDMQRFLKTAEGRKLADAQAAICKKHHNAQRLLQPVRVIIPYAPAIEFPATWLRTRRDHQRFLNLIEVIAFLHQYQKQGKTDPESGRQYIEADLRDYEIACDLAKDILPETLSDLKKPVADLLSAIEGYAERKAREARADKYEVTFSRRAIREETGLQNYRIKELFKELEELEYLEVEKSPRGVSYCYRLVSGKNGTRVSTLLTPEQLKARWVEVEGNGHFHSKAAATADLSRSGRVEVKNPAPPF
jgi:DNA primase catalytic core